MVFGRQKDNLGCEPPTGIVHVNVGAGDPFLFVFSLSLSISGTCRVFQRSALFKLEFGTNDLYHLSR